MVKVKCIATCYMPVSKGNRVVERFEDEENSDVYEIDESRLKEFLATNNFVEVA
ncbi:hypothetical protein LCGC14_2093490 [marine sediment metagenome]|uniref:Uncharacterized protein n=1 Tax=marine sediment metagenome TaxID=412755 RepID=A0A0F9EBZ1_9ZZZZ